MRAALVIAGKDLRQRLRDRSALVVGFAAPLALAVIVSLAFGSGFVGSFEAAFAVVDQDSSELSKAFIAQVLRAPELREQITVTRASSPSHARALVAGDGVSAAFLIPKGFGADVAAGRKTQMRVLQNPDAPIAGLVAEALARAYTDQINATRLSVVTTLRARARPLDPGAAGELVQRAAAARIPIRLTNGEIGVRDVSGANYFGPSMAIFFLFFSTGFAARSLLAERQAGTMPRILASPTRGASVVGGKAIAGFVLGAASMAVMFVTLGLAFGVSWGDPVAVAILTLATVLAVMGITAVVQLVARTQEQADAYSQVVAITLALLGGNFFPLFQLPSVVQRISLATPNGWALRGFSDISYDGATLSDLGPHLAVIVAFAVVTGGISLVRARRLSLA